MPPNGLAIITCWQIWKHVGFDRHNQRSRSKLVVEPKILRQTHMSNALLDWRITSGEKGISKSLTLND